PLPGQIDDATLAIEDGGTFDAATRTIVWTDAVVFPMDPRAVHFSARLRADLPPGTLVRNVATIVFPDAVPPTRIDTDPVEHVIPLADAVAPRLFVSGCTPATRANEWTVSIQNRGLTNAYNVTVTAGAPPQGITVAQGNASFALPSDPHPDELATVIPFAS